MPIKIEAGLEEKAFNMNIKINKGIEKATKNVEKALLLFKDNITIGTIGKTYNTKTKSYGFDINFRDSLYKLEYSKKGKTNYINIVNPRTGTIISKDQYQNFGDLNKRAIRMSRELKNYNKIA